MAVCRTCNLPKAEDEFPFRNRKLGTRRTQCLSCYSAYQRGWYDQNADVQRKRTRTRNKRYKTDCYEIVKKLKEETPCADCGTRYPHYVMDFDHRDPSQKKFSIATAKLRGTPPKKLLEEIAKCDIVCANCHRERTWGPLQRFPPGTFTRSGVQPGGSGEPALTTE